MRSTYSAATLSGPITASSVELIPSTNSLNSPLYFEESARTSSLPFTAAFASIFTSETIDPIFSTIFLIASISSPVSSLDLTSRSTFISPLEIFCEASTALPTGLEMPFEITDAKTKPIMMPKIPTPTKRFRFVIAILLPFETTSSILFNSIEYKLLSNPKY